MTGPEDKNNHTPDGREAVPTADYNGAAPGPGAQIGPYKLISILGEGGYGIVYLAERERPVRRRVALKVIKPGMDSREVIARFEAERQALALLDHPHIAQVYNAGTTGAGHPYFVMEYVKGLPITEHCDREKLSIDERLRLFQHVCEGIQHAHQKGIIHRDIKPSNILVYTEGNEAIPKIIDFGVAKAISQPLTGRTLYTEAGRFIGTPEYMSPEQAEMGAQNVDTRSDVYSLGVLLYELLTGALPFDTKTLREGGVDHIRRIICEHDPETPSTRLTSLGEEAKKVAERRRTEVSALTRRLHKELEWIPLRAMRKECARRYRSASELADDVRNYLNGAPLIAGPESSLYKVKKFARRRKLPIAAVAAVLVMASIAGTLLWKWRTAEKVARGQRQQRQELQRQIEVERYLWEAQRLHAGGRYNDALSKIELALQGKPTLLEARLLHARLLVEMDRGAEATAALDQLATENSDEGAIHYLLARLYRDADPRKAGHHRRLAEKLLPETADACHLRAIGAGTLKETVRWLSEGLELHPRHYSSIRARAFTYYALKDYANMEADAVSLILLRPEAPLGYALRAVARRETGRLEDALRDHDRAIQLAADDAELYAQRRETHLRKADFERALADARRCVELRPEEPTYRYYVFAELALLGRYEAAKGEYEKIIADGPQAERQFYLWATEYVFDALGAGHQVSLPDETFGGYTLLGMHRTIDYYHRLAAKARRAVAEGFVASWSPDGSELAYSRGRPGSNGIEILHLESGKTRLLTVPGKDPVWSPDGRHIAFVREPQTRQIAGLASQREVTPASDYLHQEEVWVVTPSGEGLRRLANGGFPSWSGDSKRVYFQSRHDKAICRIAVDDPAAVPTRIMGCPSNYPVVSPDEQYVAYARGSVLLVDELPSGKRVARWTAPGMEAGMLLRWSPDGQELSVGGYNISSLGLWIYDLKTQEARKIFDGPATVGVWSPDRSRFAFDVRVPIWEIWVADLDPKVPTTQAVGPGQTPQEHLLSLADDCSRAIEADPGRYEGYLGRSMFHWYLEEYEKAAADCGRAAELAPTLLGPMPVAGPSLFVAAIPDRPPPGYSTFVLSGGPDSDTPLLVDDDLELYIDGSLVFRDSDKTMNLFRPDTWGGQPISLLAKPSSKICVRVLDYGVRAAVGHVYLHHPELGSRQLLTGRSQETPIAPPSRTTDAEDNVGGQSQEPPAQEPFVLLDETFDLAEVFAVATD